MATRWTYVSSSPKATSVLGDCLGRNATPGLVIALVGDLGAGKTRLVQGLARGLGVSQEVPITSPTFSLVNPYEGRHPLYHLDLYRLTDVEELEALGFRDLLGPDSVTVVEWADRFPEVFPRSYLRVILSHRTARTRTLDFEVVGNGPAESVLDRVMEWARDQSTAARGRAGGREETDG